MRTDHRDIGCLLLDLQPGEMCGGELLARLSDGGRGYPVFLIGGPDNAKIAATAKRLKADVVDKPFDARALAQRVLAAVTARSRQPAD